MSGVASDESDDCSRLGRWSPNRDWLYAADAGGRLRVVDTHPAYWPLDSDTTDGAALYEELLELDIPTARWGWVAIHLCNLFSGKLDDADRALALLRRVADECGDTPPAEKARERLARIATG